MNWGNVNGTKDYIRTGAGVGGGGKEENLLSNANH